MCEICDALRGELAAVGEGFVPLLKYLRHNFEKPATAVLTAMAVCRYIMKDHDVAFEDFVARSKVVEVLNVNGSELLDALTAGLKETAKKDVH